MLTVQLHEFQDRVTTAIGRLQMAGAVTFVLGIALLVESFTGSGVRITLAALTLAGAGMTVGFLVRLSGLISKSSEVATTLAAGLETLSIPMFDERLPRPAPADNSVEVQIQALLQKIHREIDRRGQVTRDLDRGAFEATTLYDLMLKLSSSLNLDAVLKMSLYSSMGVFGVTEGMVMLLEPDSSLAAATTRLIYEQPSQANHFAVDERMRQELAGLHQPLTWTELEKLVAFVPFTSLFATTFSGFKPQVVCPLEVHGQFLGFILLGAKISKEPFSADNLRFLETIAPAVALVIKNARVVRALEDSNQKLDRKVFELELLNEISRKLNVVGDLGDILSAVLELSARGTEAMGGAVHLFDAGTSTLSRAALCGPISPKPGATSIALGTGLVGAIAQNLKPVNVGSGHPFTSDELGFAGGIDLTSILAVPLSVEHRPIGILTMVNKANSGTFTISDQIWIQTVANHAASVIENMRLFRLATEDGLTGLYVHRYFQIRLREEVARALRHARPLSLVLADVDHFKNFNDRYGHQVGDRVLREVSQVLRSSLREMDVPARYGGEELTIIMPETDLAGAESAAERIRRAIEAHRVQHNGEALSVTVSMGVCALKVLEPIRYPRSTLDDLAASMVEHSDAALYTAKSSGRNRVVAGESVEGL
jgi:diguanylate cyclase (GGDEF)-like protein